MTDPYNSPASTAITDAGARRILLVEDDPDVRRLVTRTLTQSGHRVVEAATMGEGQRVLGGDDEIHLAIVDLILPDGDGLDLVSAIRAQGALPIIALSARCGEGDTIIGLRLGADDYVAKPFSPRELAARVEAVLRRALQSPNDRDVLRYGELTIDRAARVVHVGGCELRLTRMEFDLLAAFATRPLRACSREQLLRWVWQAPANMRSKTVTEHVRRVRRKLEVSTGHEWIATVRGVGYRFEPPHEGESRR